MGFEKENEQESRDNIAGKKLESRITAGPITDIVPREFVQREGFCFISNVIDGTNKKEFKKYFILTIDNKGPRELEGAVEKDDACLSVYILNRTLNDNGLYLAQFQLALPPYINSASIETRKQWIVGQGDLYSTKDMDIRINEEGKVVVSSLGGR